MKLIDSITEEIAWAIKHAQPLAWHTWDSFAGRMLYHEESKEGAVKREIKRVLSNRIALGVMSIDDKEV